MLGTFFFVLWKSKKKTCYNIYVVKRKDDWMKTLYKDQVKHVAKLARLRLDEKEVDKYEVALNQILDEIEKIENVELTTNQELIAPTTNHDLFFQDTVKDELERKTVLKACGVDDTHEYIEVPKVIADEEN